MTAIGVDAISDEDFFQALEKGDNNDLDKYIKHNHLKVNLWGTTYAFPSDENTDELWTVDGLKERTFDEFKQLLIEFFKLKSIEKAQKDDNNANIDELSKNIDIIGNLVIDDISFKVHGDPTYERNKSGTKIFKFSETKYIGDVMYCNIKDTSKREDIKIPSWITYRIKNERKLRKKKVNAWNKKYERYVEWKKQKDNENGNDSGNTSKVQVSSKDDLAHLKETGNWTIKLILDNSYKAEIDEMNKKNKEKNADSIQIEYITLKNENDNKTDDSSDVEMIVPASVTIGDLRTKVYDLIMGIEANRKNIFLQNINFKKENVSLKHKFSVFVANSNETELRHAGTAKNGATIKIGIKIPLFYTVLQKLDDVNINYLDDNEPKPSDAKKAIKEIMKLIKEENRH